MRTRAPVRTRTVTTDLLAELVAIDSVNPALVPGGAGEAEIAAFVAAWLTEQGLEVTVDEPLAGRPSVVGVARGTGGGRVADAQRAPGHGQRRRAWSARTSRVVRDGRLYGRGAYDMKGGLAAIMVAGAAAARDGLSGDVIVTAVADEEHASEGVQSVLRRWRADACIVTEPTHLRACVAHKGFVLGAARDPRPRGARLAPRPRRRRHRRHGARARRHPGAAAPPRGAAAPAPRRGEPARLADRRRPGAVELSRALRARRRAAHPARRVRAGRRARAAGAARARARGRPAAGDRAAHGARARAVRGRPGGGHRRRAARRGGADARRRARDRRPQRWMDAAFIAGRRHPDRRLRPRAARERTRSRSTSSSRASTVRRRSCSRPPARFCA